MKTNIATDRSQSQRLLRCGVTADTADMSIRTITEPMIKDIAEWSTPMLLTLPYGESKDIYRGDYVEPAWSLSTLLSDILPMKITDGDGYDYELRLTKDISEDDCRRWELSYYSSMLEEALVHVKASNAIEAAVEMAEKLTAYSYKLNGTNENEQ